MEKKDLLECINFFKAIKVVEKDVNSDEEKDNHSKVVKVTYSYQGQSFTTSKLYYKNIRYQDHINNPDEIIKYFGGEVYWLDIEKHKWPKGSKEAELENTIIDEMAGKDDTKFKDLLKTIANNKKDGFIQRITADGKRKQFYHNFENNNHWHDIIRLIQEIINKKGEKVDKRFFSRLVFQWVGTAPNRKRTSLAKEVEDRDRKFIDDLYKNIKSVKKGIISMEPSNILTQKKQIILQGPPGTGKTREAKDIAEYLICGDVSDDKAEQKTKLEDSEQFKLIQFHPAYSYEDFVRGIVVKTDGTTPEYKTVNKVLGEFAKKANESNLSDFDRAWGQLIQDIQNGKVSKIDGSAYDVSLNTKSNIKFEERNGSPVVTYAHTSELYRFGKTNVKYETYHNMVLKYLKDPNGNYKLKDAPPDAPPYVLIIDEINRANLPAVLGELIYALEYRGEKVESMYATMEEGNTLILPPNLYIIGTMNTSDRSVGHIDYAIRRRFAFIEMLPKVLEGDTFESDLFEQVSKLFIKNYDEYINNDSIPLTLSEHLSEEFRPEDVWLGHSYFINNNGEDFSVRMQYEIIPILKEYIKDGILKQSAEDEINKL